MPPIGVVPLSTEKGNSPSSPTLRKEVYCFWHPIPLLLKICLLALLIYCSQFHSQAYCDTVLQWCNLSWCLCLEKNSSVWEGSLDHTGHLDWIFETTAMGRDQVNSKMVARGCQQPALSQSGDCTASGSSQVGSGRPDPTLPCLRCSRPYEAIYNIVF
jgi:hypothetical protein